jgi:Na+/melibiose symporter-like transporter
MGPLDRKRLFTAFCLTPLLAGFYPAIFLAEPSLMPIGLLLAYASTAVFGIPLVAYFDRRGVREWYMYIAGGTACSVPTVLLYAFGPLPDHLQPFGAVPVVSVLVWGASSGIVFWMIGIAGESPVSLRSLFDPVSSKD